MLPIIKISTFSIFTYPLFFGLAWGFAFNYCKNIFDQGKIKNFYFFIAAMFVSSWLGSKWLFIIVSKQYDSSQLISSSSFWLGGGFVFYGGLILSLITTWFFLKKNLILKSELIRFLPALPFAHAIGRVGCFLAGCCYGYESEIFSFYKIDGHGHVPIQLFEAFFLILAGFYFHSKRQLLNSSSIFYYVVYYSIVRFILEFFRGDEVRGIYFNLSTSQWVSVLLVLISVMVIIKGRFKAP